MEKHLYSCEEKLKWFGYGEWIEEPDACEFIHKSIKCKIVRQASLEHSGRVFGGYLCGYIRIPENILLKQISSCLNENEGTSEFEFDVHGGITYSTNHEDGLWIGFDCGHLCDIVPSLNIFEEEMIEESELFRETKRIQEEMRIKFNVSEYLFKKYYRNWKYVKNQVKSLADQLLKISKNDVAIFPCE